MRGTENGNHFFRKTTKLSKIKSGISITPPPLDPAGPRSNPFEDWIGLDVQSESREMYRIWCRLCLCQNSPQALRSLTTWTSLTSDRALHCCKKNAFNSMCLVFTSRSLAFDHYPARFRRITAQDLLCRLTSSPPHCTRTSTTSSTVVASSCLH